VQSGREEYNGEQVTPTRCSLTLRLCSTHQLQLDSIAANDVFTAQLLQLGDNKRQSACSSVVHRNNRSLQLASYWLRNRRAGVKGTAVHTAFCAFCRSDLAGYHVNVHMYIVNVYLCAILRNWQSCTEWNNVQERERERVYLPYQ